jgi:nucleotidyltransferase substrate binding protein (TIGR01987 family)
MRSRIHQRDRKRWIFIPLLLGNRGGLFPVAPRIAAQPDRNVAFDATPLRNAVTRLREGLARHEREPFDEQLRDGLIQRFGFTYELAHKTLRRYLREIAASPDEIDQLNFADLIRAGGAQGLLLDAWPEWRRYREMRMRTSHSYDAETASAVVADIPDFLREAEHLCAELERRLA